MSDNRGVVYLVAAILAAEASLAAQPSEEEIRQILVDRIDVRHVSIGMVAGIDAGGGSGSWRRPSGAFLSRKPISRLVSSAMKRAAPPA